MLSATSHFSSIRPVSGGSSISPAELFRSGDLVIRRLGDFHERLASDLLVRRMYAWRGYRANPHTTPQPDSGRVTLVAWQDNVLAATLTLSHDSGNGLLCEALYPDEIANLRARNLKVCEYSRLAIDPDFSSPALMDAFFRTAYNFARSHFHASDALVEINPRHCRYYERELGFTRLGPLRVCPRVNAPAILLHRNLLHPFPKLLQNRRPQHLQSVKVS
ncbi:MAG: hypothetical protein Q8S26_12795 [Azonexus sp.]|nr:hypothetical protein [Azonexus sp.]